MGLHSNLIKYLKNRKICKRSMNADQRIKTLSNDSIEKKTENGTLSKCPIHEKYKVATTKRNCHSHTALFMVILPVPKKRSIDVALTYYGFDTFQYQTMIWKGQFLSIKSSVELDLDPKDLTELKIDVFSLDVRIVGIRTVLSFEITNMKVQYGSFFLYLEGHSATSSQRSYVIEKLTT